ncbi:hypothetical protein [Photobacterium leiognathi]|uniref:hypothetical protein n=1 Tax=Photobacterium leiognathi TaxID=553611 RepID=UPI0029813474|nr:hypothetical protein [Photobacterium leiognathi]
MATTKLLSIGSILSLIVSSNVMASTGNANTFGQDFSNVVKVVETSHKTQAELIGLTDSPKFNVRVYNAKELNKSNDYQFTTVIRTGRFGYLSTSTQIGWRITAPKKNNSVMRYGGFAVKGLPTQIETEICQLNDLTDCYHKADSLGSRMVTVAYPQQAPTYVWLTNGYEKTGLIPNTEYKITYKVHVNAISNSVQATYGQTIELTA